MELSSEEKFDRAMKLSQRTGVSLEDAKAALNACDFDMLDAVVYLEQLGKTGAPKYSSYTTEQNTGAERTAAYDEVEVKVKRVTLGDLLAKFFKWVGKVIKIGNCCYVRMLYLYFCYYYICRRSMWRNGYCEQGNFTL